MAENILQILQSLEKKKEEKYDEDYILDLIKKYGPHDTTYATSFDAKDFPLIQRHNELNQSVEFERHFINICEAKWNDHLDKTIQIGNKEIHIQAVSKSADLVLLEGLRYCVGLIMGTNTSVLKYMAAGNSDYQPRPYQSNLFGELGTRMDMSVGATGSIIQTATNQLTFKGLFAASFPTITVVESMVANASSGGILLNRAVFDTNPINHVVNVQGFTLVTLLTFTPVTQWG